MQSKGERLKAMLHASGTTQMRMARLFAERRGDGNVEAARQTVIRAINTGKIAPNLEELWVNACGFSNNHLVMTDDAFADSVRMRLATCQFIPKCISYIDNAGGLNQSIADFLSGEFTSYSLYLTDPSFAHVAVYEIEPLDRVSLRATLVGDDGHSSEARIILVGGNRAFFVGERLYPPHLPFFAIMAHDAHYTQLSGVVLTQKDDVSQVPAAGRIILKRRIGAHQHPPGKTLRDDLPGDVLKELLSEMTVSGV